MSILKKCIISIHTHTHTHPLTHSQLDFSLFKLLQRLLSLTRREAGGELCSLNSTKELHQQVKSEEEKHSKTRLKESENVNRKWV